MSSHKNAKTAKRKTPASEQNLAKNNAPPRSPRPKQRFVPLARLETIAADLHEGAGDSKAIDVVTAKLESLINGQTAELTQVNAALRERITERPRGTQLLQTLLQETASVTGEQFFAAFVRSLATILGVRYAIITELLEGEPARLRMLAIWIGDRLGVSTEYDLIRTPCEKVITLGEACYQHSVQKLFPEDKDLAALGAVSYLGVAMRNSAGKTIGHVCLLDDKPLLDAHPGTPILKALKVFASRAAAELEREQSRAALANSEKHVRTILEAEPECVKVTTEDGILLDMNSAGLAMIEADGLEQVRGQSVLPLIAPAYREDFAEFNRRVFRGEPGTMQFEVIGLKGGRRWMDTQAVPLRGEHNMVTGVLAITRDITQCKQAEAEQRRRTALFHEQETALIELAKHPAIHGGELDSAVRAITEVAARILGVGRVGLWVYDADRSAIRATDIYEAEQNRHSSGITLLARDHPTYFQALDRERTAIEAHDAQTDPRTREFSTSYLIPLGIGAMLDVPIRLKGEMVGVLCHEHMGGPRTWTADERTVAASLATMVTLALEGSEREQALGALRDSEERFRQLAENIQEVFWMSEPERNRMLYISPTYERIWGRSCEEMYASPRAWLEAIHPEDRDHILRAALNKQAAGTYDEEYRIVRPDGAIRWIHDRAFPVHGSGGTVIRVVGVAEDVTQRRTLEEQLRQAVKMEAMGRLAGGIAHDFNNLLTVIDGYSAMLLDSEELPNQLRGQLQEVKSAAERGTSLTKQLLAFSRRQIIQPMDVDLNQLVTRMIGMLQRLIGENVNLVADLDPGLGLVRVDPTQFEQVIVNLTVNARDAMPSGGILTIETRKVDLAEPADGGATRPPESLVRLTVRDTGKGMDSETRARIFEPFFTTKEVGKGTGLGLSTVYGIVTHSKGTIEVASQPGRGASFAIFLPQQPGVARPVQSVEPAARSLSGSETILLVEDATEVRSFMRDVLGTRGYQVLEAGNGAEALRLCERHTAPIHLLISDVIMPGMGGPELANQAKAVRPMLKVLFISGYAGDEAQCAHIQAMGAAFLQKPVAPTVLLSKTREVLGRGELMA